MIARHPPFYALLLSGLTLWIVFRTYTGIVLEDALITYRYAENLALGNGFVFNEGERVLGVTGPLHALLLALLAFVFGVANIPTISTVMMMAFGLGAAAATAGIMSRSESPPRVALLGVGLVLFHPNVMWSTTGGMETAMVLFLMASGVYAAATRRWWAVGLTCGLLVLARIDGLIWSGVLMALVWFRHRALYPKMLAWFLGIVGAWSVFAVLYYGSAIPHSLAAKVYRYPDSGVLVTFDVASVLAYASWFANGLGLTSAGGWMAVSFTAWIGVLTVGLRRLVVYCRSQPLVVVAVFPPVYCVSYYAGKAPMAFPWYLIPVTWCCLVIGAMGVADISDWSRDLIRRKSLSSRAAGVLLALVLVAVAAGWIDMDRLTFRYHRLFQNNEEATRLRIGQWLKENTPEDASVATEAIGYIGTTSRRRVIDLAGLVSPEVVAIRRECRGNAEVFHRVLSQLRPDYVVLRSFEVDENRSRDGGPLFDNDERRDFFLSNYDEAQRFSAPHKEIWGRGSFLTVYAKRARE
jgi:hypothetical protein